LDHYFLSVCFVFIVDLQVLKCIPSSKILACAPSNNAADLLADKLLDHVPKESILRMNAASRDVSHLPQKLKASRTFKCGFISNYCWVIRRRWVCLVKLFLC